MFFVFGLGEALNFKDATSQKRMFLDCKQCTHLCLYLLKLDAYICNCTYTCIYIHICFFLSTCINPVVCVYIKMPL